MNVVCVFGFEYIDTLLANVHFVFLFCSDRLIKIANDKPLNSSVLNITGNLFFCRHWESNFVVKKSYIQFGSFVHILASMSKHSVKFDLFNSKYYYDKIC